VKPEAHPRRARGRLLVPSAAALLVGLGVLAARPRLLGPEVAVFTAVNGLGDWLWVPAMAVMQAGALAAGPIAGAVAWASRRPRLGLALTLTGTLGWLLARMGKLAVGRPRPGGLVEEVVLRGGETGGLGYPSGHVTIAAGLATVLTFVLPARWRPVPWVVVLLVGSARMYAGMHLPLDLVGGALLGVLVALAVRWLLQRMAGEERRPATSTAPGRS
jgi:membrane-associated phospholipid phosphatase